MVASKDIIRTGYSFSAATGLFRQLNILSHQINAYLENIDPIQFHSLTKLQNAGNLKYPHMEALGSVDPLLMEGRAIIFNRQTERHPDVDDDVNAWAALVILGKFTQGFLRIPILNLQVRYNPGDLVWIRGHILEHEVMEWIGGQHICIAHFTHSSFFREMSLSCGTGPGVPPMEKPKVAPAAIAATTSGKRRRGKCGKGGKATHQEEEEEQSTKKARVAEAVT